MDKPKSTGNETRELHSTAYHAHHSVPRTHHSGRANQSDWETLLAEYEAKQLLQNGYSDVCLQAKVTKDGIARITQAKKHGTVMRAAVMPGQSVLAQSWQAI